MSTPRAAAPGMSIDEFDVLKPISRGAFGRVYLARKIATGGHSLMLIGLVAMWSGGSCACHSHDAPAAVWQVADHNIKTGVMC